MPQPVWAVNRRHPEHRIRFPSRENAERWMDARDDMWDIVPIPPGEQRASSARTPW